MLSVNPAAAPKGIMKNKLIFLRCWAGLMVMVFAMMYSAAGASGGPKNQAAAVKAPEQLVFVRSSEKAANNLWLWTEGEKPAALASGKGIGRFALAQNPLSVIYQSPMGADEPYTPYALMRIKLDFDNPARQEPETIDRPGKSLSDLNPLVSPDGKLLVFNRVNLERYGKSDYDAGVWACRLDTGCAKAALFWKSPQKHSGILHVPTAFSPDGTRIAIQRTQFAAGDIGDTLVLDVRRREVLNTFLRARVEMWSPNGSKMIVSRLDPDTGCRLLYIGADDEDKWRRITPEAVSDGEQAFSPDGRKIAVHARDALGDSLGIWLVDVASGGRQRLSESGSSPQWSKDGRRIYFRRRDEATEWVPEIWVMGPDGDDKKMLVKNGGRFRLLSSVDGSVSDEGDK